MAILIHMMAQLFVYKCGKCGLVQQYDRLQGNLKCPKCGWTMQKQ